MFTRRIRLFTILGFDVHIDLSWFIILVLVTWSLVGVFSAEYPGLTTGTYWWMGVIGALGLFTSIVLHELAHSLVARRFGVPMKGITLFIFGGVAEMTEEPPSPKAEFSLAIAGPIASVVIGAICWGLGQMGQAAGWPDTVNGVLLYLGLINGILVAFNVIPAFPLDGGRVLRSALWAWKNNLRWATRISSYIGSAFGILLILLGVMAFIGGSIIAGMWYFLIGLFLRSAAQMSYQQLLMRRALEGEPVRRFMQPDVQTVEPSASVRELVEDYIYRHHFKMFPVVEDGHLRGCVTTRDVRELPRDRWESQHVAEIAEPCSPENTIRADADATEALAKMSRNGSSRLMVVEGDRLLGMIALKDLMRFIALKVELEEGHQPPLAARSDRSREAELGDLRDAHRRGAA